MRGIVSNFCDMKNPIRMWRHLYKWEMGNWHVYYTIILCWKGSHLLCCSLPWTARVRWWHLLLSPSFLYYWLSWADGEQQKTRGSPSRWVFPSRCHPGKIKGARSWYKVLVTPWGKRFHSLEFYRSNSLHSAIYRSDIIIPNIYNALFL